MFKTTNVGSNTIKNYSISQPVLRLYWYKQTQTRDYVVVNKEIGKGR